MHELKHADVLLITLVIETYSYFNAFVELKV